MDETVLPAVEERSALYPALCDLRAAVSADPLQLPGRGDAVRAELLPRRVQSGEAELRRLNWSVRRDGFTGAASTS